MKRNEAGKTPYDVSESHTVRQYLLPLQFQTERNNDCDNSGQSVQVSNMNYGGMSSQQYPENQNQVQNQVQIPGQGPQNQGMAQPQHHQAPLPMQSMQPIQPMQPMQPMHNQYSIPVNTQSSQNISIQFQSTQPADAKAEYQPPAGYNQDHQGNQGASPVHTPGFQSPPVAVSLAGPLYNQAPTITLQQPSQPSQPGQPMNNWTVTGPTIPPGPSPGGTPPGSTLGPPTQTVYRPSATSSSNHRIIQPGNAHLSLDRLLPLRRLYTVIYGYNCFIITLHHGVND